MGAPKRTANILGESVTYRRDLDTAHGLRRCSPGGWSRALKVVERPDTESGC
jgi:hypothetical protein